MFFKLSFIVIFFAFVINNLQLYGQSTDSLHVADSFTLKNLLQKADAYYNLTYYDSALLFYEKAEEICLKASESDSGTLIRITEKIGTSCFSLKKIDKASKVINRTTELSLNYYGSESFEYAKSLINLSTLLIYFQKNDEALGYLLKANEIFRKDPMKNRMELAKVASNVTGIYRVSGLYGKALESINEGINLLNSLQDNYEKNINLFKSYINLGNVYSSISLYEKAMQAYIKALELKSKLKPGDDRILLILYNNLSAVFIETGDNKNLLASSFEAYKLCKKTGNNDYRMIANIITGIGSAYMIIDSLEKSEFYMHEAIRMAELQKNKANFTTTMVYQNYGNYFRKVGIPDSAKHYYYKSLDIILNLVGKNHIYTALNYKNIAELYASQSFLDSAIYYYLEAYRIYDTIHIKTNIKYLDLLYGIADAYYKKGNYNESEKFLLLSETKMDEYLNNSPQTEAMSNSFLKIYNDLCKISYLNALMLGKKSNFYESLDKLRAVQLSKESKDKIFIYEMADSLEKEKYKNLKENLYLNQLSLKIESEKGNVDEVTRLTLENKKINDSINNFKNRILLSKPGLFGDKENRKLADQLSEQIKYNQAIICYLVYEDTLWINLIHKNGYEVMKTPIIPEWRNKIKNYLTLISCYKKEIYKLNNKNEQYYCTKDQIIDALGAKKFADYLFDGNQPITINEYNRYHDSISEYFYNLLILPVEDKIQGYSELIIIPDEELDILPFMSLYTVQNGEKKYLVEKYNIRFANSLTIYLDKNYRAEQYNKERKKDLLAIGISKYNVENNDNNLSGEVNKDKMNVSVNIRGVTSKNLANLEFTKLEIDNITSNLQPSAFDILYDSMATEKNIKSLNRDNSLMQYKIIHIAAHGFLEDKGAFGGSLALYNSAISEQGMNIENDGFLSFFEILKLNLRASLVVLSACNTGRGKLVEGEGVYGLNYAFYMAGANNIISSLWEIDDKTTSAFFSEFYARIKNGETYCLALNNIYRIFISHNKGIPYPCKIYSNVFKEILKNNSYYQPYYWSAFTLW